MGLGGRVRPAAANQNEGNNAGDEQPAANEDEQEEDGGEGVEGANNGNNGAQGGEIPLIYKSTWNMGHNLGEIIKNNNKRIKKKKSNFIIFY